MDGIKLNARHCVGLLMVVTLLFVSVYVLTGKMFVSRFEYLSDGWHDIRDLQVDGIYDKDLDLRDNPMMHVTFECIDGRFRRMIPVKIIGTPLTKVKGEQILVYRDFNGRIHFKLSVNDQWLHLKKVPAYQR